MREWFGGSHSRQAGRGCKGEAPRSARSGAAIKVIATARSFTHVRHERSRTVFTKYIAGRYSPAAPRPALMRAGEAADSASAALVVSFTEYAEHAAHSRLVQPHAVLPPPSTHTAHTF